MTYCRCAAAILITTMSLSAIAPAAVAPFHLTTSNLSRRDVQLKAINATNIVVFDLASKREQTIPNGSVVALSRSVANVSSDGMYVLRLRDGQRIVCRPTAIKNDAIACATRELGERTYPVADVASLAVATLPEAMTPGGAQDELRLANGDQLRGIVSSGDAKSVTCQTPDGQAVAIDWTNVRAIRFAETQPASSATGSFLVTLASGTRVRATKITVDDATVVLTVGGDEVRVLAADLASIEHLDGDATMLAWVTPTSTSYVSYFPSSTTTTMPTFILDPAAAEKFGATTAIRVRPKTALRWTIDPAFGRLHARVVIPAGNAFADVTVRVLDGDRIAFERKNRKSGVAPLDVDVTLSAGGSVSLEVDYGDGFDVQDRVIWLDAAVLKSSLASPAK